MRELEAAQADAVNAPRIPWLRVFVEGVVIVGSILLALALDAWWDEHQERVDERVALAGLQADFMANRSQLGLVIDAHLENDRRLAELEAMRPEQLASMPFSSVQPYLQALHSVQTFDSRDGTLDGLVASGQLPIISDSGLRGLLVVWKSQVDDLVEESNELRSMGEQVLLRTVDLGGPWRGDVGGWEERAESTQPPPIAEARLRLPRGNLAEIASDEILMGLARAKRFRVLALLSQMEPLVATADSVLLLIRTSLE